MHAMVRILRYGCVSSGLYIILGQIARSTIWLGGLHSEETPLAILTKSI